MTGFQRNAPAATPKRQPSKRAKQLVRDAFDPAMLAHLCTTWDFTHYAERVDLKEGYRDGRERFYWHKDNGSKVLAIAHLDSVQNDGTCTVTNTSAGLLAVSGALDDRLGVYVILDLLPKLGITCDWLLTTDEEMGASTAEEFTTDKDYNWMFQFDRGGTDVVMYDYETDALCELVEESGARVGDGSYSDICRLEHLGCAGFNWGVGYQDYHSPRSHAWLEDTFRMVARFGKFYYTNADTHLHHDPRARFRDHERGLIGKWWHETMEADCTHTVNIDDPDTYAEVDGLIICDACANVPDYEPEVRSDLPESA